MRTSNMNKYFLGIDVGGTKTQSLISDLTGEIVGTGISGAGNHESVGYEGLIRALNDVTDQAMTQAGIRPGQIAGAGFGVAGYDWPSELPPTLEAISTLGLDCPIQAVNDTVIGLIAGTENGWGVAVVAGTGCNCWGRDEEGREGRVTGDGGRFGEFGGAGEIVGKALQAVAYAQLKRGPATALTELLVDHCGARDAFDLMEGLVLDWYSLDAGLAPQIFSLAYQGDSVSRQVIEWAGRELGGMAAGVIHQLGLEEKAFDVILVGSVFEGGALIIEPLQETVREVARKASFRRLNATPVIGAVLLGMEAAGIVQPYPRRRLVESTAIKLVKFGG
jgi:N-acetylglucosamine kinase-like BadF-type ATPase